MLLITIVSDQVIQNLILIKELKKNIKRYLFITTPEMERANKTDTIVSIFKLEKKNITKIIAKADNLKKIYEQVTIFLKNWPPEKEIYVNLTGGTKLMSMAVYNATLPYNPMYLYLPPTGQFYYVLKDKFEIEKKTIKEELTIHEYLESSGFYINDENWIDPIFSMEDSNKIFHEFKKQNFDFNFFPIDLAKKLCQSNKIEADNLPGLWFEDFIYQKTISDLTINKNNIARNIKFYLEKEGENEYELDMAFTRNNELYLVECKVSINKTNKTKIVTRDLEKLSIIARKFGYNTKTFFLTLSEIRKVSKPGTNIYTFSNSMLNKMNNLNIEYIADKYNFNDSYFNLKFIFFLNNKI